MIQNITDQKDRVTFCDPNPNAVQQNLPTDKISLLPFDGKELPIERIESSSDGIPSPSIPPEIHVCLKPDHSDGYQNGEAVVYSESNRDQKYNPESKVSVHTQISSRLQESIESENKCSKRSNSLNECMHGEEIMTWDATVHTGSSLESFRLVGHQSSIGGSRNSSMHDQRKQSGAGLAKVKRVRRSTQTSESFLNNRKSKSTAPFEEDMSQVNAAL